MRRFDHFSNAKVAEAARVMQEVLEKTLMALHDVQLETAEADAALRDLEPLWRKAIGATRNIGRWDLRNADRGAGRDFKRAEESLWQLRRKLFAAQPPMCRIVADWLGEANSEKEFIEIVVAEDSELYQTAGQVILMNQASINVELVVVYLFFFGKRQARGAAAD